jgi:G:T/U-mismatch repair DNA glycosylase
MATAQEQLGKKVFNSLTKEQRAYLIKATGLNDSFTEAEKSKLLNGDGALEKIANTNPVSSLALSAVKVFGGLFKKKKKKASSPTIVTSATNIPVKSSSSKIPIVPIAIGGGVLVLILLMRKK